jgi:hypothetical protein
MWNENEWVGERQRLQELSQAHPEWSLRAYARELQHDPKWVSKWVKRFKGAQPLTLEQLRSQSRRPKRNPRQLVAAVKDRIGEWREVLSERFNRAAGAKTIAYFLSREPKGTSRQPCLSSIQKVLAERGYIRRRVRPEHMPLVLPAPMEEWELDFGEIYLGPVEGGLEFMLVVDRGTSLVVNIEGSAGYQAESAIDALVRLFAAKGLPRRLRFDRDPRLWGSWTRDSYPSPFIRLLHALGVEPIICPPHRPDKKPMVERCIGTLKHEWLARHSPSTFADALALLDPFIGYHNRLRPHQGDACHNRIPAEAFPVLPVLPRLPERVTPDAWLQAEHGRVYRRHVNSGGSIQVDRHPYYVGYDFAGATVLVQLDAPSRLFQITCNGRLLKSLPIKGLHPGPMELLTYLEILKTEARSIEYYRITHWHQPGDLS